MRKVIYTPMLRHKLSLLRIVAERVCKEDPEKPTEQFEADAEELLLHAKHLTMYNRLFRPTGDGLLPLLNFFKSKWKL